MMADNLKRYLNQITCGDALTLLKELPDESVDCMITSPPYWGLRDYGHHDTIWDGDLNCEHEWGNKKFFKRTGGEEGYIQDTNKASHFVCESNFCIKCGAWQGQLGLEPTFKLYIQHLLNIFKEVKRVLKKTATCWVNIGDTYSGSGNESWNAPIEIRGKQYRKTCNIDQEYLAPPRKDSTLLAKCLIGIPERFALAMTDELGFIRRNTIIWSKPNCMPASVSDRFTVDFEYLYFFTKSPKYYFEQQFELLKDVSIARLDRGISKNNKWINGADGQTPHNLSQPRLNIKHRKIEGTKYGEDGKGLHDHSGYYSADGTPRFYPQGRNKRCVWTITTKGFPDAHFATFPEKLIETPIKAGCPEKGIVLDPFCGSGTTASIALKLNRNFIGFEISQKYVDMANKRLKPYRIQGKINLETSTSNREG